ncbi:MAG: SGNH/GDSL hydrolase family protein [Saprospiraceae bacterium]|nr:SGNH/GDSL hydrolase family protein [Saprospiraceae bacterium]
MDKINPIPIDTADSTQGLRYLALGDSYTIGEDVAETESYPFQLFDKLKQSGIPVNMHKIIARTGWTTADLKNGITQEKVDSNWHLVSLLIGVNNQYRGQPISRFETEFRELLEWAIALADGKPERVFVVSIPDYGVTPFGINSGKGPLISMELDNYNSIKENIAGEYNVAFYYITDISRQAENDPSLLAPDKLHPSGKMYKLWLDRFFADVLKMVE